MKIKKHKIRLAKEKGEKPFILNGWLISLDLYKVDIEVAFGSKKEVWDWFGGEVSGFVYDDSAFFLWVDSKNNKATLVHELYHLVNFISKRCGLSDDTTNEQQAYLIGYLYDVITKLK